MMIDLLEKNPQALIQHFTPLNQVSPKYHSQLATQLRLIKVECGETILRKTRNPKLMHFLVKGSIEVRESFENRYSLNYTSDNCSQSLEAQLAIRSSAKASEDCYVLVANTDQIDQYLIWSQDYSIFYLDEGDLSLRDDQLIDDNFQEDWDNVFILSKLAANLSNRVIHQLLSQLEDIPVKQHQTIVKNRSDGDYFYLIKEGFAVVHTESNGPFKGQRFTLEAGNYFGDEALIAHTQRNATVTMSSDGILGRLDIETFNTLIKQHLVTPLTDSVNTETNKTQLLDVRLPIEYKLGHKEGSINMPVSSLRKQLSELKESLLYVISPADDRRSELATYLMRQAGYQAYYLPSTHKEIAAAEAISA